MKKLLIAIALCCSLVPLFSQNRMALDNAINDFAEYVTSQLPANNRRIAVIAFETNDRDLMVYVIDTLLERIWEKGGGITIVERQNLEPRQRELNYSLSGYVSDETAQSIGHTIGADTVIYGSMSTFGNTYRLTLRATDVESSKILVPKSYNLPMEKEPDNARFWSVGASVGTSLAMPWLIGTIRGTIAPFRNSFLELGVDVGLISGKPDVDYYSIYPFAHYAFFLPFEKGGWYIGGGVGFMIYAESAPGYTRNRRIIAADAVTGINLFNVLDISYTLHTNFGSVSNKFSVGYTYRF
jgi:hypothetical protein